MLVSVCIITYNQENYIKAAIDSVLEQKTDFDLEIVIGDDCSTDKTASILKEYKKKYGRMIRLFRRRSNLGIVLNFIKTIKACRGKYIALLEGDDYWVDPKKIQTQVNFLESHKEFSICSHSVATIQGNSKKTTGFWFGKNHRKESSLRDLLQFGSGGATCSLVFRNKVFGNFPAWFNKLKGGDWPLQILCVTKGKMYYFNQNMAVYRKGSVGNSTTRAILEAKKKASPVIGLPYLNTLSAISIIDKSFQYKYSSLLDNQRVYAYFNLMLEFRRAGNYLKSRFYAKSVLQSAVNIPPFLNLERLVRSIYIYFTSFYYASN